MFFFEIIRYFNHKIIMNIKLEIKIYHTSEFPNRNLGTSGSSENLASDDLGQNLSSPTTLVTKFLFSNAIAHEISISNSKISGYVI